MGNTNTLRKFEEKVLRRAFNPDYRQARRRNEEARDELKAEYASINSEAAGYRAQIERNRETARHNIDVLTANKTVLEQSIQQLSFRHDTIRRVATDAMKLFLNRNVESVMLLLAQLTDDELGITLQYTKNIMLPLARMTQLEPVYIKALCDEVKKDTRPAAIKELWERLCNADQKPEPERPAAAAAPGPN